MACLGVHFAITDEQRKTLEACADDDTRIDYIQETIEQDWDEDHLVETDKAWDAIHRCLGDFPPDTPYFYPARSSAWALPEGHGEPPLRLCVLGGRKLMDDESRYFVRLIEPGEVADVASALAPLDEAWLRGKYFTHCKGAWPEYGEEDFAYMWEYFQAVRDFFARMAGNGRAVIFTADQ